MHLDYDTYDARQLQLEFHFAITDLVGLYCKDGITLTTLPNIADFRSMSGTKDLLLMDRPDCIDETE